MDKDYLTLHSGCPVMISNSFINLILQSVSWTLPFLRSMSHDNKWKTWGQEKTWGEQASNKSHPCSGSSLVQQHKTVQLLLYVLISALLWDNYAEYHEQLTASSKVAFCYTCMLFLGENGRGGCGVLFFFNDTEEQDVWSSLKEHMNKENLFVDFSYMFCCGKCHNLIRQMAIKESDVKP